MKKEKKGSYGMHTTECDGMPSGKMGVRSRASKMDKMGKMGNKDMMEKSSMRKPSKRMK